MYIQYILQYIYSTYIYIYIYIYDDFELYRIMYIEFLYSKQFIQNPIHVLKKMSVVKVYGRIFVANIKEDFVFRSAQCFENRVLIINPIFVYF
jgi:hypothetical protein